MDSLTWAVTAGFETTIFLDYLKNMPDRRQRGKVAYRLDEILLLALLSILAGAEGFTDMAWFEHEKLPLLQRFLPFANDTPIPPSASIKPSTSITAASKPGASPSSMTSPGCKTDVNGRA